MLPRTILIALLLAALSLLAACDPPQVTPTKILGPTLSPTAIPAQGVTPTLSQSPIPLSAPTLTPIPAPKPTAIPTPTPTTIPTPTPTTIPTPTPTTIPTPTMTPQETAAERLGETVPWFSDPPDSFHYEVAIFLTDLWLRDRSLADVVARLEWIVDGIVWIEADLLKNTVKNPEVMEQLVSVPWFIDGITHNEGQLLLNLAKRGFQEPYFSWVLRTAEYTTTRDLRYFLLFALSRFGDARPSNIDQLMAQPWINDGLEDDEVALLVYLSFAVASGAEFNDALGSYSLQSASISLPLAGEVTIRAFREGPFAPGDNLLEIAVESTPFVEELMGLPLPTTDIILIVVPDLEFGGMYSFESLLIRSYGAVPHEIGHYYTESSKLPHWLREGTADFASAYVDHRTGVDSLEDRRIRLSEGVRLCVEEDQFENLSHLYYLQRVHFETPSCAYAMGLNFLLEVLELVGREAMSAILKELYLAERVHTKNDQATHTKFVWGGVEGEQAIYEIFLRHTPPVLRERFQGLYRRLHGGPHSDRYLDRLDDHSDEAVAASRIAVGNTVEGGLDYAFDFDYFRFRAEEGRKYRIGITHETLRPSSVYLYSPDGQTLETSGKQSLEKTPSGIQMLWIAPRSGDYYFVVHNFGGHSGTYELTISNYAPSGDDHGDNLADATGVLVDEVVKGTMDDGLDLDYFWLNAEANEGYRIYFTSEEGSLYLHRLWLYYSDGTWAMEEMRQIRGEANGQSYLFVPATSGRRYFSIESLRGAVAAYAVTVQQEPIPQDT